MRLKRVCVFAGSSVGGRSAYREAAEATGRALAQRGIGLVYGGAKIGLMGALADAALASRGEVIGLIPEALVSKEIAHAGLSQLRVVATMHERKATMAELSDAFVAIPGGWGTLEELFEVITWAQLGLHRKPCGLLNVDGYFDPLLTFLEHSTIEGFVRREHAAMIAVSHAPESLLDLLAVTEAPVVKKWIDRETV